MNFYDGECIFMGKNTYKWVTLTASTWKIPLDEFVDSYGAIVKRVAASEFSRKFVQAAFPKPEFKVDIVDFMKKEKFKVELMSELVKLEKKFGTIQFQQESMTPFWLLRPPIS